MGVSHFRRARMRKQGASRFRGPDKKTRESHIRSLQWQYGQRFVVCPWSALMGLVALSTMDIASTRGSLLAAEKIKPSEQSLHDSIPQSGQRKTCLNSLPQNVHSYFIPASLSHRRIAMYIMKRYSGCFFSFTNRRKIQGTTIDNGYQFTFHSESNLSGENDGQPAPRDLYCHVHPFHEIEEPSSSHYRYSTLNNPPALTTKY